MSDVSLGRAYVSDTVALVLWLEKRKLPQTVAAVFKSALEEPDIYTVWIPAIALAEIGYLHEKGRIEISPSDVLLFLQNSPQALQLRSLDAAIIVNAFEINDIPELHDRLIAGTALYLDCPILTNDPVIERSRFVHTIWK